ncbi:39S ribosomal protein L51, mitochondrial [Didymosphaeria variabile]|uniref:Large ribosomal subunit protein mL43 n=1 Tax=Didymosphaeria variabile TaxID=1932322 RepID=A0A9W8XQX7_9PLEO|nr:39S ribosomal protein L51, mitochondrial [Didymosphaeria variabile]KAJ4356612.1 39S ribosomal protein L51, mitochondrial [Didymosphaeria variabile]
MPVSAIQKVATAQNGVGAFILPCKRITLRYCDWAGSSKGMNAYLKTQLGVFAKRNPQIEIQVYKKHNHHPVITANYLNGHEKTVNVKNMTPEGVREKIELLRNSSPEKNKRVPSKPVTSINENVRGIWSPFHGAKIKI